MNNLYADEVDGYVEEWLADYTKAELLEIALEHRIPLAPVRTYDEVRADPSLADLFVVIEREDTGPIAYPGPPYRLAHADPPEADGPTPAPTLGQHNQSILCDELGYSRRGTGQTLPDRHNIESKRVMRCSGGTMNESTVELSPLEYLAAAERELAADNPLEGSRLLWKAAEATFCRLAQQHRLDDGNLHKLARALDRKEGRNFYYVGSLSVAQGLKDHAEMDMMEDYELASAHIAIRPFIVECNDDGKG